MASEPFTILVQSRNSQLSVVKGELVIQFYLPTAYLFREPHYVRLFAATGLQESVFVHLSFASLTPFDQTYRRHLATLVAGSLPGPFSQVDGNFISSLSELCLGKVSGEPFEKVPEENIVLYLQVVPASWIHNGGPGGHAQL